MYALLLKLYLGGLVLKPCSWFKTPHGLTEYSFSPKQFYNLNLNFFKMGRYIFFINSFVNKYLLIINSMYIFVHISSQIVEWMNPLSHKQEGHIY